MAEHFILEYDEESRYALVKLTAPTSVTPYVVCYGYDPEGCDWRQGSYHETLDEALADYRNATRNVDEEEESTVRGFALHGTYTEQTHFDVFVRAEDELDLRKKVVEAEEDGYIYDHLLSLRVARCHIDWNLDNAVPADFYASVFETMSDENLGGDLAQPLAPEVPLRNLGSLEGKGA